MISLLTATCLVGCGAADTAPGDVGPADARDTVPDESYTIRWGPITVQPGVEDVRCITQRLGNAVPVNINEIHNVLGDVSHHLIVYRGTETEEVDVPYPCDSIDNLVNEDNGWPLMITQKSEETLTLPPGVAFKIPAQQMIRLELHYINASDQAKEVSVVSRFTPIPDTELEHPADLLFIGDPDIDIPAGGSSTLGPIFLPMYGFEGATIFGVTGHEHQWGTNVSVELADSATGPFAPLYDLPNFRWDEPETLYLSPPQVITDGGGFRFTCDWSNQSNRRVYFGESANDEMCFFWAYYYPPAGMVSRGSKTCFHTEKTTVPIDVCCPGHQLCNVIDDMFGSGL